jgi:hypothetical protein
MAGPVRVVGQNYTERDAAEMLYPGIKAQRTTQDGFINGGDTLTVSDKGLMPWQQKRAFDPGAYNVANLDNRVAQNNDLAGQYGTGSMEVRGQQGTLAQMLADQAAGRGPSVAQQQLQQGTDKNIATQMAMAATMRGANQAGALRQLGYQQAGARQQMAGDAATLRLNEQNQAQNQLGQLLAGMRGADEQQARFYGQTSNDLLAQQLAARQAREQAAIQYEGMLRGVAVNTQQNGMQAGGSALAALGGLAALSDETKKSNIEPGDKELGKFLSSLTDNKYEYKDKKHGEGTYWSPMAQDLEKTEVGKSMVVETSEGKVVDYARGLGAYLASLSHVHKRLKKLEAVNG